MILDSKERGNSGPLSYAARLKYHFRSIRPIPTRQNDRTAQIHKDLSTCALVFVRVDAVRKPLQSPFKVLERKSKYFILDRSELPDVNPTSVLPKPSSIVFPDNVQPSASPVQSSLHDTVKSTTPPSCASRHELSRTRCGRRVALPSRLADYVQ
ncbi:unnamed protein product [Hymenolepis diminuta]|uniref:Uncharacterized protein n=1 Tax=Hymenolepis diminuta TaxID=6216 RepID=A0A564YQ45_HYMDI|nr:unnamed protein product [Hymenolepis diminuta]